MNRSEIDKKKLSPMMVQFCEVKEKNEDTILFFRLGDFYEMFFEDAITCSKELELTLTGKSCGLEERVPMCGVPYHAYKAYLDRLIEKGYKVAIVEQTTDPSASKGIVERDVIQIVTKGTIIDDSLNSKDYNYLGTIYDFGYSLGLGYIDISTGKSYAILIDKKVSEIIKEVNNLNIKELIVSSKVDREIINILRENYNILITIRDEVYEGNEYKYIVKDVSDIRITTTINHLLSYLIETKKGSLSHLRAVEIVKKDDYLKFDIHTKRNLELVETIRNNERQYSLLWLLDKTKTAMGSRFLKQAIEMPLRNKKEIIRRQNIIETFLTEFILKEELRVDLDKVYDLERLASRISYGNLNARDLIQLKNSLKVLPSISKTLESLKYDKKVETLDSIYSLLDSSINEDAPITLKEGSLIKEGYNKELDELKNIRKNSKDYILEIEAKEKEKTGIKTLKVGFNKVFGYYIEVSKGAIAQVKDEFGYDRKQTLANCERFITPELKEKENIILGAEEKIINLEYKLFMEIRDEVKSYISNIQEIALTLAEVDMLLSMAIVAEENSYLKPTFNDKNIISITDGRHPVVEKVLKNDYVPNDIIMDEYTNILLITGPNMAGKSTYMRQLAITVIMAQIGSYVPCSSCDIPIFDAIYTRIGASDDLVSGDSTFMVEMKEANTAISEATKNSLILFDELGRGTATFDGMSLAWSILEHIHDKIGAKTMFATHYHELVDLEVDLKRLRNVHVSAVEEEGNITFLHKVKDGAVDKSYGIHVAALAKLPEEVINRANEILKKYEKQENSNSNYTQTSLPLEIKSDKINTKDLLKEKLDNINPLETTPIEALNILYELKKEIGENNE